MIVAADPPFEGEGEAGIDLEFVVFTVGSELVSQFLAIKEHDAVADTGSFSCRHIGGIRSKSSGGYMCHFLRADFLIFIHE